MGSPIENMRMEVQAHKEALTELQRGVMAVATAAKNRVDDIKQLDGRLSLYADRFLGVRDGLKELKGTVSDDLEAIESFMETTKNQIDQGLAEIQNNARRCMNLEDAGHKIQNQADRSSQLSAKNENSLEGHKKHMRQNSERCKQLEMHRGIQHTALSQLTEQIFDIERKLSVRITMLKGVVDLVTEQNRLLKRGFFARIRDAWTAFTC